mmetsp:Transcript_15680/g.11410  ORF Transcript_15680/g.11410 Transcript_15680/m.11410 type:complete len:93 (-) Transcript_15680:4015-4293(-)
METLHSSQPPGGPPGDQPPQEPPLSAETLATHPAPPLPSTGQITDDTQMKNANKGISVISKHINWLEAKYRGDVQKHVVASRNDEGFNVYSW